MFRLILTNLDIIDQAVPWLSVLVSCLAIVICCTFLSLSLYVLIKKPSRESFFGYKTKLSLINDEIYAHSNKLFALSNLILSSVSLILSVILMAFVELNYLSWIYSFIGLFIFIFGYVCLLVFTPIVIKNKFKI